jgi:hypothetical protein
MNPTVSGPPKIPAGRRSSHSPAPGAQLAPPERCPYCWRTSGVQPITGISPKVQAWSCRLCHTQWAVSLVNPHLRSAYLVELVAAAAEIHRLRSTLRQVITLADDSPQPG